MKSLKKNHKYYDARLDWVITLSCNLNCAYCIQNPIKEYREIPPNINISALIKRLNETKKIFRINLKGGEPFLIPNIIDACIEITKNHYISFITNLTSDKIKEFTEKINPKRVIEIYTSLHIKPLERQNLLDKFINNYRLCKEKGFKISANIVAYPPLLNEAKKYKNFFLKKGIQIRFTTFVGKFKGKIYPISYSKQEIKIFGLNRKTFKIQYQKGKLCNSGYNIAMVIANGNIRFCVEIENPIGNIYDKIKFIDKIFRCPFEYCSCPINVFDKFLLKKAIKEANSKVINPLILEKYVPIEYLKKKEITSKVLLSFCIPTYNRAKQILELLNHIIQFKSEEIEIVVSDNASSDETHNYVKNINDSRIKYFRNEKNYGFEANLLLAIKRATGKFIFTLMDDDKIELETIPWILKNIKTNNNLTQLCGQLADKRPFVNGKGYFTTFEDKYLKAGEESLLELLFYYPHSTGVVLRKDVLDLKGAFECIDDYNIGTLFICEFLIAQAMIKGDTLCTSKVFSYIESKIRQSSVPKINGRPYWHPLGRLYIIKFKIHIIEYLEKKIKNFKKLKEMFLGWQINNIRWVLKVLIIKSFKNFVKALSIALGIKIFIKSPRVWYHLTQEIIFLLIKVRFSIYYPKILHRFFQKSSALIRSF